ncbi:ATP-dependent dethiobiotin synthetase BioD, partial [Pengzhenrongella sp.]|uniref:ATP-dependent dethiobiotin synthetase BioD n=1 Tax=Pengzhenrongella sp. TaxID=2888820 RepID=UPI002F92EFD8
VLLAEPLAPVQAARLEGAELPPLSVHAARIAELAAGADHVLVEGAGGLLVELDAAGGTLADLAALTGPDTGCVVVARPGLGTLNHVALTLEALHRRDLTVLGLVLGTWPQAPVPAEHGNRRVFTGGRVPLLGVLPERAAQLAPAEFRRRAVEWLSGLPA